MSNNLMNKFSEKFEQVVVPIAGKLTAQRHICAIKDAFIMLFPLTMAGSLMLLINFTILAPDGFIASMLKLHYFFPNLAKYQEIFSPILRGSTDIMALLIVFLVAKNLADSMESDGMMTGLTAISVFLIIYPSYIPTDAGNALSMKYMGPQGLFVALLTAIIATELMAYLSKIKRLEIKMPEQVPPAVTRSFKALVPIIITTVIFAVLNYIVTGVVEGGIHDLVYSVLQKPLTSLGTNIISVIVIAIVSNLLWSMGIHGPNTVAAIRDTIFAEANAANLQYVSEHGTAWGAPYPVTWAINDAFGNMGGLGMTIGLLIAIFIFSKKLENREIAKLSIAPGIFNINEPVIFGLPIILNPIMIVPFILAPVVNIIIAYTFITLQIIPPITYGVPWTTPGPIMAFLGTGGNFMALVVSILCLIVSVLIYTPFVIAANKIKDVS